MKGTIREEKGAVLIMVLILLVVGGLILTPLLGLMSTGLIAGQVYEKKTDELYAADAGIEDALWRIKHNIEIPTDGYNLTVNNKYVWVTVQTTDTQQFLGELLDTDEKNWVHSDWVIFGKISEAGVANITVTWNGSGNQFLTDIGIWLSDAYSYVEGQPTPADDIRIQYENYTFEQTPYAGGTAFIWTWPDANQANGPSFDKDNRTRTLTFEFSPESIPDESIAFTMTGRQDVGLSYDGGFNFHTITAVAITDAGTATADIESQTKIVTHAIKQCMDVKVMDWHIS
jgi:hypothetical protein